ncbi:MAG TPA: undecaprenyldiphospho-muramoylpentapeptide beta-N-acetylglucosaminyltransferase [Cyclobacteriaceae bacterium]|nr:undecaprenyldiphospho-muramoylpentapeptide beta-N-acetylglucosaminyltransferase [Cyclobacteriaceae bacterium]
MKESRPYRVIISGGGTGGHVFPAIAIANAFRERHPDTEILFVGAEGKMEMSRVPEAGYKIIGLRVAGIQRRLTLTNLLFPFKLIMSILKARGIIKTFKPNVVVGTGGYASGPVMMAATNKGIPALIQEQNSYAGLTNKRVGRKAKTICVAYYGMEKFFPKDKIVLTGNPVRKDIIDLAPKRNEALSKYGFHNSTKTLLIIGGSLGARTINESVFNGLDRLIDAKIQVIWQTGKFYYDDIQQRVAGKDLGMIRISDFVKQMDLAYAAADVVISRAGALSISELCLAKKPAILVPSPNVSEDHQTQNALALVKQEAAVLIKDNEAREKLITEALALLNDTDRCVKLSSNIAAMGKPEAALNIVKEIEKLIS